VGWQAGRPLDSLEGHALTIRRRKVTREITVETTESILIRRRGDGAALWCSHCGIKTEMVSVEEASVAMGVNARSVNRWIESGRVHSCEPQRGVLRVCLRSLSGLPGTDAEEI
jgi:hypothetical protein